MDGLLVDLRDNVSITVYFDFTYSGLHRSIVFFLSFVSLLHYLAIKPSRLQLCCNKISCQLSGWFNAFNLFSFQLYRALLLYLIRTYSISFLYVKQSSCYS